MIPFYINPSMKEGLALCRLCISFIFAGIWLTDYNVCHPVVIRSRSPHSVRSSIYVFSVCYTRSAPRYSDMPTYYFIQCTWLSNVRNLKRACDLQSCNALKRFLFDEWLLYACWVLNACIPLIIVLDKVVWPVLSIVLSPISLGKKSYLFNIYVIY